MTLSPEGHSEFSGSDASAQERFMRLWTGVQSSVEGYIHTFVRDRDAAKDVLQETALAIFRRFPEYDGGRPFLHWALGFARYEALGWIRDHARSRVLFSEELLEQLTERWAELAPEVSEQNNALHLCMEKLTVRSRDLIRWSYFEGLTSEEVAGKMGGNAPWVRVTLQRIREQLKECIERRMRHGEVAV